MKLVPKSVRFINPTSNAESTITAHNHEIKQTEQWGIPGLLIVPEQREFPIPRFVPANNVLEVVYYNGREIEAMEAEQADRKKAEALAVERAKKEAAQRSRAR